jgi:hypothetical protein
VKEIAHLGLGEGHGSGQCPLVLAFVVCPVRTHTSHQNQKAPYQPQHPTASSSGR